MIKITELAIIIDKPVSVVYDYMINHENYPNWYPNVISVIPINDLPAATAGKQYREKLIVSKKRQTEFTVEVKEVSMNQSYALEADWRPLLTRMEVSFKEHPENRTRINLKFYSRSKSVLVRLLIFLFIAKVARNSCQKGLEQLKDLLEQD